jgi:hypothetical protein
MFYFAAKFIIKPFKAVNNNLFKNRLFESDNYTKKITFSLAVFYDSSFIIKLIHKNNEKNIHNTHIVCYNL